MTPHEYICIARKSLNMTQEEFADRLHTTRQTVSKWERGWEVNYITLELVRRICEDKGIEMPKIEELG